MVYPKLIVDHQFSRDFLLIRGNTQFSNTHVNPKHGEHLWFLWVKKSKCPTFFVLPQDMGERRGIT